MGLYWGYITTTIITTIIFIGILLKMLVPLFSVISYDYFVLLLLVLLVLLLLIAC